MNTKYIIGIDGGTQSTKVVIFDTEGNIVCEGKTDLLPLQQPTPGTVIHPGDDLWDSLISASRKAFRQFKGNVSDIIAVGLCTIRCCRALLKEDGSLAHPVLSWMDVRLSRPYEHTDSRVRYVTTTSGYTTHRLTGQFNDTVANYEGEWPLDRDAWAWSKDPEVIEKYRIPRDMLFNLQMPGEVSGYVTREAAAATGIPAGLPVVATANDKAVESLGAGSPEGDTALVSLGTYIAAMMQGHSYHANPLNYWTNLAAIPHEYLYESFGIRRGMWTISWFRDLLGDEVVGKAESLGISPEMYLNRIASAVPAGADGLMTVPNFLAPPSAPYKKGIMIGFDGRHGRAHLFRSILESIALTMKNNVDAMCDEMKIELRRIIVSGGGSNGDLFMQIFSDVFGIPAVRNVVNGSASMGAAICAAVAVGAFPDFRAASAAMVKVRDQFVPDAKNHELYCRMNREVYRNITNHTDEILKKSHPIFG